MHTAIIVIYFKKIERLYHVILTIKYNFLLQLYLLYINKSIVKNVIYLKILFIVILIFINIWLYLYMYMFYYYVYIFRESNQNILHNPNIPCTRYPLRFTVVITNLSKCKISSTILIMHEKLTITTPKYYMPIRVSLIF